MVRAVLMHFNILYLAERCMKACAMGIIDFLVLSVHDTQKKRFKWNYLLSGMQIPLSPNTYRVLY